MEAGTQVRLTFDSGRIGICTGRTRARGSRVLVQVHFTDGLRYIPIDQLEIATSNKDPVDLLRAGKVGRSRDLRRILTHTRLTGRLADLINSMETTNTDFYAYQFKPVLKMLNAPNQALLIAAGVDQDASSVF